MEMRQVELSDGVLKVDLDGSFDIAGAGDVDLRFSVIGGSRDKVLIDFSRVSFLASMGIRVLVKTAKAMNNRGGKLAVVNPNEAARKVLSATGADTIIAVVDTEADGIAALS
jgi:anti-anti-sigma factor